MVVTPHFNPNLKVALVDQQAPCSLEVHADQAVQVDLVDQEAQLC